MKRSQTIILLLAALSTVGACNRDTPTAPTPPPQNQEPVPVPATLTGLVVSAPESQVVVGSSLAMRANGRYSDGTLIPVQPQWSVSPAAAADISPSGVLTARSPADVRVTARLAEFEAQVNVRVAPNYAGTWRGSWRRLECFGPRCGQGDFSNPVVDLLITQTGTGRVLSAVMLFGPWDGARYVLSGRGLSVGGDASLGLFWLERGPAGERLFEISTLSSAIAVSERQTLGGRMSMRFTEGRDVTRLEFNLVELALVSRAVRLPD